MPLKTRSRSARRFFDTAHAAVELLEERTLLSAGALDTSFGGDGIVAVDLDQADQSQVVKIRPDGTIVTVGWHRDTFQPQFFQSIVVGRIPPNGAGSTFNSELPPRDFKSRSANFELFPSPIAFQSDQKILIGGTLPGETGPDTKFAVLRLDAKGDIDTTFGESGVATVELGFQEDVYSIAVQPDGKIILAGRGGVARLNSDGSLDTTFGGGDGVLTTELDGVFGESGAVVEVGLVTVQPDGKLILVGEQDGGPLGVSGRSVVRLLSDGSFDATFGGGDGIALITEPAPLKIVSVLVQVDGRILIAGTIDSAGDESDAGLVRLNADGSLDTSFGSNGSVAVDLGGDDSLNSMAVDSEGRIVIVGAARNNSNSDISVARLDADGSLDATFGSQGIVTIEAPPPNEFNSTSYFASSVAIQPDGRIVLAGSRKFGFFQGFIPYDYDFLTIRLLSGDEPHRFDLVGRANNGDWRLSSLTDAGTLENSTFSHWSPSVNWQNVVTGDFDGDGLTDIAGRVSASGSWWVSLASSDGSLTRLAGQWSTATQWFDVAAVDLAASGDRGPQGHFTNKSDIIGRDQWGHWWAAVSNGDGTFTNVLLATWNAAASFSDTQFLDVNNDGATDIVSRTGGTWWGLISRTGAPNALAYDTVLIASWVGTAGWHGAVAAHSLFRDGRPAIAARTFDGHWFALEFAADGSAMTRLVSGWYEGAGWQDVQAADLDGDGHDEIIGRTSTGGWWELEQDDSTDAFTSHSIGMWYEAAGWNDVRTVSLDGRDVLIGRIDGGAWWLSSLDAADDALDARSIGSWNPSANWRDVRSGTFHAAPVTLIPGVSGGDASLFIRGDRAGTDVTVRNASRSNGSGVETGLLVTRTARGETREQFYAINTPVTVTFSGHNGVDTFDNESDVGSFAFGRAGNDSFDGLDNDAMDSLFGGDGVDMLLGDPGDVLVQDGGGVMI